MAPIIFIISTTVFCLGISILDSFDSDIAFFLTLSTILISLIVSLISGNEILKRFDKERLKKFDNEE